MILFMFQDIGDCARLAATSFAEAIRLAVLAGLPPSGRLRWLPLDMAGG
jgi:hypothetical protein